MSEIRSSVIYRDEPLTSDDYREAIQMLEDALRQPDHKSDGCTVCHDSSHFADRCPHNPLLAARHWACNRDEQFWRCFHCDAVFGIDETEEAQDHFGTLQDPKVCVTDSAHPAQGALPRTPDFHPDDRATDRTTQGEAKDG